MAVSFPSEVIKELKSYVYRLIDPRNGETFYVGKGKGNRVFAHAAGHEAAECMKEDEAEESPLSDKITRIREIINSGLSVQHVIHRHGLDDKTAFEVEAALIEAYPSVTNAAGGHGSADRGVAHAQEIIRRYTAEQADITDPVIEIIVNRSANTIDLYDATRFSWKINQARANKAKLALAVEKGLIIGVFEIDEWLPAISAHFPTLISNCTANPRFGFVGRPASAECREKYYMKKVEPRARGAANPIRYHNI
ncbi:MAG: hypothetical protein N4A70_08050 [Pelagimonas sp.]|jgi:hypothetical protein|nr:hypothetical protein [Pelagimonas sp.]